MFDKPLQITETNDQIARVFIASILNGIELSKCQYSQLGEYLALSGETKSKRLLREHRSVCKC